MIKNSYVLRIFAFFKIIYIQNVQIKNSFTPKKLSRLLKPLEKSIQLIQLYFSDSEGGDWLCINVIAFLINLDEFIDIMFV